MNPARVWIAPLSEDGIKWWSAISEDPAACWFDAHEGFEGGRDVNGELGKKRGCRASKMHKPRVGMLDEIEVGEMLQVKGK